MGFTYIIVTNNICELLPHIFTLTIKDGGIFSAALFRHWQSQCPAINWHLSFRSPDFPLVKNKRLPTLTENYNKLKEIIN
tara:strand:- start:32181 stop:32420 length:240 start_codon:yes stop_codon:yes gene_type:complete